ncbi:Cell morphogenesis protein PAG1 [Dimargaris verticillata]|uniref:Cell morphogenesis protein PAG1 n=1 Tax=Dimargaris verticillata TaxID=2761393 RepID=A0A9W8B2W0_9FUNG|nr:Cell morphogenesis protein PAG1 [Dimargaris verticillata]
MPFSTPTIPADAQQFIITRLHQDLSHYADTQIRIFANAPSNKPGPDLVSVLGPGTNEGLDRVMRTMALVARSCPKEVIDSLLQWRRETLGSVDDADTLYGGQAQAQVPGSPTSSQTHAQLQTSQRTSMSSYAPSLPPPSDNSTMGRAYPMESQVERQELASVYVLCRALITIFENMQSESVPEPLGKKMEEITFSQLRNADYEALTQSRDRQVIADLYAQLIGCISGIQFATMSDRFIAELEKIPPGPIPNEPQVEVVVRGMRYLRLKIYPVDALEETAQFLLSCTKFFLQAAHGLRIKFAYAEVFTQLLLPIGAVADAEVNFPDWAKSMEMLLSRATKMCTKPRYTAVAYPLMTAVLCASRREVFLAKFMSFLDQAFQRLKDRHLRNVSLGCVCRLVWAYLFRYAEPMRDTHKKLEALVKHLFGTRKRPANLTDMPLHYYVYVVFCLLHHDFEWTVKNVFYFLVHVEDRNPIPVSADNLSPERISIGLRALLLYLQSNAHVENRPPFPVVHDMLASCPQPFALPAYERLKEELRDPVVPWDDHVFQLTDQVKYTLSQYWLIMHDTYGHNLLTQKRYVIYHPPSQVAANPAGGASAAPSTFGTTHSTATVSSPTKASGFASGMHTVSGASSANLLSTVASGHNPNAPPFHPFATLTQAGQSTAGTLPSTALAGVMASAKELTHESQQYQQRYQTFMAMYPRDRQPFFDLLTTIIDITPDLTTAQLRPNKIIENMVSYLLHIDSKVARAAASALVRFTKRLGAYMVVSALAEALLAVDDRIDEILTQHVYTCTPATPPPGGPHPPPPGPTAGVALPQGALGTPFPATPTTPYALAVLEDPTGISVSGSTFGGLLHLYSDVLGLLLSEVLALDSSGQLNNVADRWNTDHRAILQLIDKVEAFGLFYLAHRSCEVRRLALTVLHTIARIGEALCRYLSDDHPVSMSNVRVRVKHPGPIVMTRKFIHTELANAAIAVDDGRVASGSTKRHPTFDPPPRRVARLGGHAHSNSTASSGSDRYAWPAVVNTLYGSDSAVADSETPSGHTEPTDPLITKPDTYITSESILTPQGAPAAAADSEGQSVPVFDLAQSTARDHQTVWNESFAWVMQQCYDIAPQVVFLTRDLVNQHFHRMYSLIINYADVPSKIPAIGVVSSRHLAKDGNVEYRLIAQWQYYLEFISATLIPDFEADMTKRWYVNPPVLVPNVKCITTAQELVKYTSPLMACENPVVRLAVVHGLGCIHEASYRVLMGALKPLVDNLYDAGLVKTSYKGYGGGLKRDRRLDRTRASLVQLYALTARFLRNPVYLDDRDHVAALVNFVKETKAFLSDPLVQAAWEYQHLRIQFCGLVDTLYYHLSFLKDPTAVFAFKTRLSLFIMFELWCGFGQHGEKTREREAAMMVHVLERYNDVLERGTMTSMMEEERTALEGAALRAMATLCRGPVVAPAPKKPTSRSILTFDLKQAFQWADAVFASPDRRVHTVAGNALKWLLEFNQNHPTVLQDIMARCYTGDPTSRCTRGYFSALRKVITAHPQYPYKCAELLPLALLKVADANPKIRHSAFQLIQVIERRFFRDRCYEMFESSVFSPLATLYRHAQVGLSTVMSEHHAAITSDMVTEIFLHLEAVNEQSQREMLRFLRPWFCNVQLQFDQSTDQLQEPGHCQLLYLFYLTLWLSKKHLGELEQLWAALVYNGNAGNCNLIVRFLLNLALNKRNPTLLEYVKKVVVFLARTEVDIYLIDTIIAYITPAQMIPRLRLDTPPLPLTPVTSTPTAALPPPCHEQAKFDAHFPTYVEGALFSPGQVALILLVELPSEVGWLLKPYLPLLLHVLTLHVDYSYPRITPLVRVMLANFIRYAVLDHRNPLETVDGLLHRLSVADMASPGTGPGMSTTDLVRFINELLDVFASEELPRSQLCQLWGETALCWGTQCPVRNMATSSFRIFNVIMPRVTLGMGIEMVNRLSNIIADDEVGIQEFSLSILGIFTKALKLIPLDSALPQTRPTTPRTPPTPYTPGNVGGGNRHLPSGPPTPTDLTPPLATPSDVLPVLDRFHEHLIPMLFWAAGVCLFSHLEGEYEQGLAMLETIVQHPGWRFPSIHNVDYLFDNIPLHLQAQMGFPIVSLAAGASTPTDVRGCNPVLQPHTSVPLRPRIMACLPRSWGGHFPGIFWLLTRGFRFPDQRVRCQKLIHQIVPLASDPLVGITEAAVVLLLLTDFPVLCQHIQSGYNNLEADLFMKMVAVIIRDVVVDSAEAQAALLELCDNYLAERYRNVDMFVKDIVRLFRTHFSKYIADAIFLLLFQLPSCASSYQAIVLQILEMFVVQNRSSLEGLFDREDTLPSVNILISMLASSCEPQVSFILNNLVFRYQNTRQTSGYTQPIAPAPLTNRTPMYKVFTWYGFNPTVSRPKARQLLHLLVEEMASQELNGAISPSLEAAKVPQLGHIPDQGATQEATEATVPPVNPRSAAPSLPLPQPLSPMLSSSPPEAGLPATASASSPALIHDEPAASPASPMVPLSPMTSDKVRELDELMPFLKDLDTFFTACSQRRCVQS